MPSFFELTSFDEATAGCETSCNQVENTGWLREQNIL